MEPVAQKNRFQRKAYIPKASGVFGTGRTGFSGKSKFEENRLEKTPSGFFFFEVIFVKTIYLAHPLRGDIPGNIARASELCREISREFPDVVPVCPLTAFSFLDDENPEEREQALAYCLELLSRCDELWLAEDWRKSEGCKKELLRAKTLGKPVFVAQVVEGRLKVNHEPLGKPIRVF